MDAVMGSWEHFGVFSFQLATVINNYNSNLKTGRNFSVFPIKKQGQLRSRIQLRWRRDQLHGSYCTLQARIPGSLSLIKPPELNKRGFLHCFFRYVHFT